MSENMQNNRQNNKSYQRKYHSVLGMMFRFFVNVSLLSMLAWAFLILWFGVQLVMNKGSQPAIQIEYLVKSTVDYLGGSNSIVTMECVHIVQWLNVTLHKTYFYSDQLMSLFTQKLPKFINESSRSICHTSLILLFGVAEVIVSRLTLFALNIPLLISVCFILVVDGLSQRDIRKFSGARESTFFFHRLKPIISKLFYMMFFIFMCAPIVVPPVILFIPMSVFLGLMTMVTIKSYKKYM